MKRILHITDKLQSAGIESFIMNVYRRIDRKEWQFDFLVMRDEKEFYDYEISNLGGKKNVIRERFNFIPMKLIYQCICLYKFLKENPYELVHIHATTPLKMVYLWVCKIAKVKVRIYHSHSSRIFDKNLRKIWIYNVMKKVFSKYATNYFACSITAAEWMFPKEIIEKSKYVIMYNGVDTGIYTFDSNIRRDLREKLGIGESIALCHIGRFSKQKNQKFLIDIFSHFDLKESMKLFLIGDGELFLECQNLIKEKNLTDSIQLMGVRDNVNEILNAMDIFVMPSLYEGLPVAAVEAQSMGLPCFLSTNITKEVVLTPDVHFLDCKKVSDGSKWLDSFYCLSNDERKRNSATVKCSVYNINSTVDLLSREYRVMLNEEKLWK